MRGPLHSLPWVGRGSFIWRSQFLDGRIGSGGNGGRTDALYFTAGIPGPNGTVEDHGFFGLIEAVLEPPTFVVAALVLGGLCLVALQKKLRRV
jgi:hypothetical protein